MLEEVQMKVESWQRLLAFSSVLALGSACNDDTTEPTKPAALGKPELSVVSNSWTQRANMPSDRWWPAVAVVQSNGQSVLYAIAGEGSKGAVSTVQAYNTATNTWTNRTPIPRGLRNHNGAAVIGGKIYVAGGDQGDNSTPLSSLFVYDPQRNTWTSKRSMPHGSASGVSAAIDGKLYVLTQCGSEWCESIVRRTLYRYDPATDQWTTLGQAPNSHAGGMAGVINGRLYVVGGCCGSGPGLLDVYDPATNAWSSKASMNSKRYQGASAVVGGKLYVIGGTTFDGVSNVHVRTTSRNNPVNNTWTTLRPMPQPRSGIGGARILVDGQVRIEVVGGNRPGNNLMYVP